MAEPPSDFATLQDTLKDSLLSTTRTASSLCAEDLSFQRSLDPDFARGLDRQNARLLSLAERLLGSAVAGGAEVVSAPGAIRLPDGDALDAHWGSVVDVVDSLLEKTDGVLDEVRGVIRKSAGSATAIAEAEKSIATVVKRSTFQKSANILKPQRTFEYTPDNFAAGAWKPLLTSKPNARDPLEKSLRSEAESDSQQKFQHPYQTEIEAYKYPPSMYQEREVVKYLPFESTTATLVDTPEALDEMIAELKKAKEIAVDLEHHDFRSYVGIVCLMQISTRDRDWIVDTLKPWRRRLEKLNEVFTDPNILKVLHGSSMDIIWLQRDFGVYINGLFDTEQAASALRYPKRSLAYLLEKFVNFLAQKQYQLADWRVRPLSKEMFDYARSDTHFLLYIYDCMHNELVQNTDLSDSEGDLIERVLRGSKSYQLQRYENPIYDAENGMGGSGWYKQLFRTPALLSKQQFAVFKALHQWRDTLARREDDSFMYVMSNHTLMTLSKEMPTTKEDLLTTTPSVTASMRQHVEELVKVIQAAKEAGVDGLEMRDQLNKCDEIADAWHNDRVQSKQATLAAIVAQAKGKVAAVSTKAEPMEVNDQPSSISVNPRTVKAGGSHFWGATLRSPAQRRHLSSDVRLALPMPDVTAEIFAANGTPSTPLNPQPMVETPIALSPISTPVPKAEEFFTIKDMGRNSKKRKANEAPMPEAIEKQIESDVLPSDGGSELHGKHETEEQRPRRENMEDYAKRMVDKDARKKRKDEKRNAAHEQRGANGRSKNDANVPAASSFPVAKKPKIQADNATTTAPTAASMSAGKQDGDNGAAFMAFLTGGKSSSNAQAKEEEEEPFDYANAPSVLEGSGKRDKKRKNKRGRMDGFDPYAKASNAPNGLPRVQKERAGKSGTFKS